MDAGEKIGFGERNDPGAPTYLHIRSGTLEPYQASESRRRDLAIGDLGAAEVLPRRPFRHRV